MGLSWLLNDFICNDLYAPFVVKLDNDYYPHLMEKYNTVLNQAEKAGADDGSLAIIQRYRKKKFSKPCVVTTRPILQKATQSSGIWFQKFVPIL